MGIKLLKFSLKEEFKMAKLYAKSPSGEDALLSISITGFTQSLQQNGWCKLPNGLLLQWARTIYTGEILLDTKYYPIAFPTSGMGVVANHNAGSSSAGTDNSKIFTLVIAERSSSFQLYNNDKQRIGIIYIAIGY